MSFSVPVLLIGFNRPQFSACVLDVLRKVKPARLYVACDGPRPAHPSDADRCQQVRQLYSRDPEGMIDWPCEIFSRFNSRNEGCRETIVSALDWVFSSEDQVIILEDDIVPDVSFFPYCEELLDYFRYDSRVGSIAANNLQRNPPVDGCSYRFSIYSHAWGWATWKRAWDSYDKHLSGWAEFRDAGWLDQLGGAQFARIWTKRLNQLADAPNPSVWDLIWQFTCWQQGYLTVVPEVELVRNIGFGPDATHTLDEFSPLGAPSSIAFPLRHPKVIQADRKRDHDTFRRVHARHFFQELRRKALKAFRLLGIR